MKSVILSVACLMAGVGVASAAEIAPMDVKYDDYGAIAESLTGASGNVAEGRKVMSTKSLGNCVSCHAVSEMADVPFHGEVGPELIDRSWSTVGVQPALRIDRPGGGCSQFPGQAINNKPVGRAPPNGSDPVWKCG